MFTANVISDLTATTGLPWVKVSDYALKAVDCEKLLRFNIKENLDHNIVTVSHVQENDISVGPQVPVFVAPAPLDSIHVPNEFDQYTLERIVNFVAYQSELHKVTPDKLRIVKDILKFRILNHKMWKRLVGVSPVMGMTELNASYSEPSGYNGMNKIYFEPLQYYIISHYSVKYNARSIHGLDINIQSERGEVYITMAVENARKDWISAVLRSYSETPDIFTRQEVVRTGGSDSYYIRLDLTIKCNEPDIRIRDIISNKAIQLMLTKKFEELSRI